LTSHAGRYSNHQQKTKEGEGREIGKGPGENINFNSSAWEKKNRPKLEMNRGEKVLAARRERYEENCMATVNAGGGYPGQKRGETKKRGTCEGLSGVSQGVVGKAKNQLEKPERESRREYPI